MSNNVSIKNALVGLAMGMAEVIPGVSGGTIAFISGIYERLLNCIKSFDAKAIKYLFSFEMKKLFKHIDGMFLVMLAIGMGIGIVVGVLGVGYLMDNYPAPLWAFFFGLIIASALFIGRQVERWSLGPILAILIGLVFALGISFVSPTEGSTNLLWVFVCGVIAISALILPGVSGSFLLLLLGMYTVVRGAAESVIVNQDISALGILVVFALGCGVGLLSFARVMSYAFKHYKNTTLALLTGFMLGSLLKIWPWRNIESYYDKATESIVSSIAPGAVIPEDIRVLTEAHVLPASYQGNPQTVLVIISMIVGFLLIFLLMKNDPSKS